MGIALVNGNKAEGLKQGADSCCYVLLLLELHGCFDIPKVRKNKGRVLTEEHRAKLSAVRVGKRHSLKTRAKIAASVKAGYEARKVNARAE